MAQSTSQLRIRPYMPSDLDRVLFTISKCNMEPLTVANNRCYVNPMSIAVWVALACVFIQIMDWWPGSQEYGGLLAYLTPMPAFAATAVPVMFFFDWLNRPLFERAAEIALRQKDILNIQRTYSLSPSSGFYILEYEGRMIGILGLDASSSSPARSDDAVPDRAVIRHFYVFDPYRQTGVQDDLLVHAIKRAFSSPDATSIEASYSMLTPYVKKALLDHGFKLTTSERRGHLISWQVGVAVLQKSAWDARQHS